MLQDMHNGGLFLKWVQIYTGVFCVDWNDTSTNSCSPRIWLLSSSVSQHI